MDPIAADDIAACILRLCAERGPDKTICPSDVARALAQDEAAWRALMPRVRAVATELADRGEIAVLQKGVPVDAQSARGPIRLGYREA